jgi:alanine dehydrogenase
MVAEMEAGSVIVDVAVDQGGCVETCRPTTHDNPTYEVHGVVHYAVANMPGAVPRTSTFALCNATIGYARQLADHGLVKAAREDKTLALGINTFRGHVPHAAVADALGVDHVPLEKLL